MAPARQDGTYEVMSFAFRFLKAPAPRLPQGKTLVAGIYARQLAWSVLQDDADRVVGGLTYGNAYSYFETQYLRPYPERRRDWPDDAAATGPHSTGAKSCGVPGSHGSLGR